MAGHQKMHPLFLVSGLGMMVLALAVVLYWQRHERAALSLCLWGAFAWVVGTVTKSVAVTPFPAMTDALRAMVPRYLSEPVLWLYVGLLTGVSESCVVLLFAHLKRIRSMEWRGAVAFGLGFGAIEAVLLGAYSFGTVLLLVLSPDAVPAELAEAMGTQGGSLLFIPAPIFERFVVMFVHAFSCVLIIYAVQTREWRWFWFSFVYKTVLDTIAGVVQTTVGVQNLTVLSTWVVELSLLPFGIVGLWGLCAFRDRWPHPNASHLGRSETAEAKNEPTA